MPDVDIDLLRPSPYQPRLYFELDDLKKSIEKDTMLVGLLVREKPEGGTLYEIIDGERRWHTAQELNWLKVPVEIRNVDDETARRMVYTLNEERQPYNSEENTKFFRRMYDEMGAVLKVAKAFQRPEGTIWNYINISMLPEYLQKAVWNKDITIGTIRDLEPLFTEARDEIGGIGLNVEDYKTSPTYQRIVAICEGIYKGEIKGPEARKDYVDPYLQQLDKARIDRAKEEVEKAAPADLGEATVKMETSEDYVRAAELLIKEAQRRKTPEQKAEEERKKLIAEARKSLGSTAKKIERANKVMDVTEFRDRLSVIERDVAKNPAEAKAQLGTLAQEVREAEQKAKSQERQAKAKEQAQKLSIEDIEAIAEKAILTNPGRAYQLKETLDKQLNQGNRNEERRNQLEPLPMPEGKYRTIVIDPPWSIDKIPRIERLDQFDIDYPTMTIDEIMALPIPELADENGCHIYLWTTHKHLHDALHILEAWGAEYQCLMTWVKNVGFTPFSWMYSTEHCLFARIGNLPLLKLGKRLDFEAKVREHSRKPDEFYNLIKEVSPEPRIDMFSREKRDGFAQYGDEVDKFSPEQVPLIEL